MKSSPTHLLSLALRTCRDAEIVREERTEVDLARPDAPRTARGVGIRVNHEGRLGFAWSDSGGEGEDLLERAIEDSARGPEGILFAHGILPPLRGLPAEPDFDDSVRRLGNLIRGLDFMLPSLVPERDFRLQARLLWQRLSILTRSGERAAGRTLHFLTVRPQGEPWLMAGMYTARPDETPSEILCRLAWRSVHSGQLAEPPEGALPAVFTATAAGRLLRDLAEGPLDIRSWAAGHAPPPGERWLHPDVHVREDGTMPDAFGSAPFDGEGLPRKPVPLVSGGRLVRHLADRAHARTMGVEPPGTAVRDWGEVPRPGYSNLVLEPGDSSLGELCAEVGDGLLLDRLSPSPEPAPPGEFCRRADLAFVLRGGRPVRRIPPVLVRGRYEQLLGGDLLALGRERAWHGRTLAPPLAVASVELEVPEGGGEEVSELPGCWW